MRVRESEGCVCGEGRVKMERVWQRMVGAQSEQDEREASKIVHGVERFEVLDLKIDSRERMLSRKDRKHTLGYAFSL